MVRNGRRKNIKLNSTLAIGLVETTKEIVKSCVKQGSNEDELPMRLEQRNDTDCKKLVIPGLPPPRLYSTVFTFSLPHQELRREGLPSHFHGNPTQDERGNRKVR